MISKKSNSQNIKHYPWSTGNLSSVVPQSSQTFHLRWSRRMIWPRGLVNKCRADEGNSSIFHKCSFTFLENRILIESYSYSIYIVMWDCTWINALSYGVYFILCLQFSLLLYLSQALYALSNLILSAYFPAILICSPFVHFIIVLCVHYILWLCMLSNGLSPFALSVQQI